MQRIIWRISIHRLLLLLMAVGIEGCATSPQTHVRCGIDVLARDHFKALEGRHVALITNQTSLDREGHRTASLLAAAGNFKLICLLSPEHGLYGNVDERVGNTIDAETGLKVYSLYGKTTRPTDEMLEGVDTLVFDIQDVGARFYTYSSTLGICMEEAARRKLKFMVLDRPNPVTGLSVDGPIADAEHFGFTAYGPLPVTHGMTFGELARLYNDAWGIHGDLTVVPMENWRRRMWYDQTGLRWVNPSPNLRNLTAATLYPAICLLEATNVSVGRGTDRPFEQLGAPWMDGLKLAEALNGRHLPGLSFIPVEFTPQASTFKGQNCRGVQIVLTDRERFKTMRSGVTIVWVIRNLFGTSFQSSKVEKLLQNKEAMVAIAQAKDPRVIESVWQSSLQKFKLLRLKYLIYE